MTRVAFALFVAVGLGVMGTGRARPEEPPPGVAETAAPAPATSTTLAKKARGAPPAGLNPGDLPTGLPGFGTPGRAARPGEPAPSPIVPQPPAEHSAGGVPGGAGARVLPGDGTARRRRR